MRSITRRSAFAVFAAAFVAPLIARAQGATNAPAGGIASSTAPSNSQGTPAGGTGVVGSARVSSATPAHTTRRRRPRRHTAKPATPQ